MQAQSEPRGQMQRTDLRNPSDAQSDEKADIDDCKETSAPQEARSKKVNKDNENDQTEPESLSQEQVVQRPPEPPFSIFSSGEKRFVVIIASLAALFSPLSANIYYPALNTLSEDLHESLSKINLTITTYLVRQLKDAGATRAYCIIDLSRPRTGLHWQSF